MRKDWPQRNGVKLEARKQYLIQDEMKAFNYYTTLKVAYMWIPIIAIAGLIASYNKSTRLILLVVIVGGVFRLILKHLEETATTIKFSKETITYKDNVIVVSEIQDYFMCTNVEKYFLLRVKTKDKKYVVHIDINYMKEVERFFIYNNVLHKERFSDNLIRYAIMFYAFPIMLTVVFFGKIVGII